MQIKFVALLGIIRVLILFCGARVIIKGILSLQIEERTLGLIIFISLFLTDQFIFKIDNDTLSRLCRLIL